MNLEGFTSRVLIVLVHEEPDSVPIDLNGIRSTGIMGISYNALKSILKLKAEELSFMM